ncbi:hypothetical protein K438DRAFT_1972644 [Mycena galopus ATCC 62051]|nr:hypothetical protein K438DRAFT_1972644 [Mycena galopus ATCC 62051]
MQSFTIFIFLSAALTSALAFPAASGGSTVMSSTARAGAVGCSVSVPTTTGSANETPTANTSHRQIIDVEYQGNTIQITVADECPGCQVDDGIDLTEGVMAALDSNYINDGVIPVVYSFA